MPRQRSSRLAGSPRTRALQALRGSGSHASMPAWQGTTAAGNHAARLPAVQGNKTNNLAIVYTPASNLRKSADMAVGQVRTLGRSGLHGTACPASWEAPRHGFGGRVPLLHVKPGARLPGVGSRAFDTWLPARRVRRAARTARQAGRLPTARACPTGRALHALPGRCPISAARHPAPCRSGFTAMLSLSGRKSRGG